MSSENARKEQQPREDKGGSEQRPNPISWELALKYSRASFASVSPHLPLQCPLIVRAPVWHLSWLGPLAAVLFLAMGWRCRSIWVWEGAPSVPASLQWVGLRRCAWKGPSGLTVGTT